MRGQAPRVVGLTSVQPSRHPGSLAKLPRATPCLWMNDTLSRGDLLCVGRFPYLFRDSSSFSAVRLSILLTPFRARSEKGSCPSRPSLPAIPSPPRSAWGLSWMPSRRSQIARVLGGCSSCSSEPLGGCLSSSHLCLLPLLARQSQPEIHACWLRAGPARGGVGSTPAFLRGKG